MFISETVHEELARFPTRQPAQLLFNGVDPAMWRLGNVQCLGSLPAERLAALYRSADLQLLPSVGEG